jgi:hypothetical protein
VANLPPVSATPRYQRHRWQFATGINDTGGKFATDVIDTGGKKWKQDQAAETLK